MSDRQHASVEDFHSYFLVTGANGGLGYAICCRLIDEFILTRPSSHSLRLIITTRDKTKSHDTIAKLKDHIFRTRKHHKLHEKSPLVPKIYLQSEQVDLCQLRSVQILIKKLSRSLPKLDTVILNAGLGGFTGIDWPLAIWAVLTNFRQEMTYPTFKLGGVGDLTAPQISNPTSSGPTSSQLGQIFCSNVFGHYLLVHGIANLLSNSSATSGRVIWISSLEAYGSTFSIDDLQGLSSPLGYESSKRLTDILALTSRLPVTQQWVDRFLPSPSNHRAPKQYVAHPGICATNILPIHWILVYFMVTAFYLARWTGSPWHTVMSYKGACAPVWLALASQEELDAVEREGGAGKWGSAIDWQGEERASRTEVQGWGIGGKVGDNVGLPKSSRLREAEDLNEDGKERFALVGRSCWHAMEKLRVEWEELLKEEDD
ncbi:3-keto-steroid reductase [Xanthoria calcicola]